MPRFTLEQKICFMLRLTVAIYFIGHGFWGIATRPIWYNNFASWGTAASPIHHSMPVVGIFDLFFGSILFFYPTRPIIILLIVWGIITVALHPLGFGPFVGLIAWAGNMATMVALVFLTRYDRGEFGLNFKLMTITASTSPKTWTWVLLCLQLSAFTFLEGQGWWDMIMGKDLAPRFWIAGFSGSTGIDLIVGSVEIIAAVMVLLNPTKILVLACLALTIGCDIYYSYNGLFEWVGKAVCFGVLLALWFALHEKLSKNIKLSL